MIDKDGNGVTIRDYLDFRVNAIDEKVRLALTGVEAATALAAQGVDRRLEAMNEFRRALEDQTSRFVTRSELQAMLAPMGADLRVLRESKANLEGKASRMSVIMATAISVTALFIGLASLMFEVFRLLGR